MVYRLNAPAIASCAGTLPLMILGIALMCAEMKSTGMTALLKLAGAGLAYLGAAAAERMAKYNIRGSGHARPARRDTHIII